MFLSDFQIQCKMKLWIFGKLTKHSHSFEKDQINTSQLLFLHCTSTLQVEQIDWSKFANFQERRNPNLSIAIPTFRGASHYTLADTIYDHERHLVFRQVHRLLSNSVWAEYFRSTDRFLFISFLQLIRADGFQRWAL